MKNLLKTIAVVGTMALSFSSFAEVSVVVHPSNTSSISDKDVSRIYLGKMKSFNGGGEVVPISQETGAPSRSDFNTKLLRKSNSQLKAYWSKLVFTGKNTPPKEVIDDAAVLKLVSENPSMIGYVDSASVTADVKVVHTF